MSKYVTATGAINCSGASRLTFRSMKHDAIVDQGIPIHERVPIPDEMIPEDSRVEIDAKIHAGYCESTPLSSSKTSCQNSLLI